MIFKSYMSSKTILNIIIRFTDTAVILVPKINIAMT